MLIDISGVPLTGVHAGDSGLTVGRLARMSDVAADPGMRFNNGDIAHRLPA